MTTYEIIDRETGKIHTDEEGTPYRVSCAPKSSDWHWLMQTAEAMGKSRYYVKEA